MVQRDSSFDSANEREARWEVVSRESCHDVVSFAECPESDTRSAGSGIVVNDTLTLSNVHPVEDLYLCDADDLTLGLDDNNEASVNSQVERNNVTLSETGTARTLFRQVFFLSIVLCIIPATVIGFCIGQRSSNQAYKVLQEDMQRWKDEQQVELLRIEQEHKEMIESGLEKLKQENLPVSKNHDTILSGAVLMAAVPFVNSAVPHIAHALYTAAYHMPEVSIPTYPALSNAATEVTRWIPVVAVPFFLHACTSIANSHHVSRAATAISTNVVSTTSDVSRSLSTLSSRASSFASQSMSRLGSASSVSIRDRIPELPLSSIAEYWHDTVADKVSLDTLGSLYKLGKQKATSLTSVASSHVNKYKKTSRSMYTDSWTSSLKSSLDWHLPTLEDCSWCNKYVLVLSKASREPQKTTAVDASESIMSYACLTNPKKCLLPKAKSMVSHA